MVCRLVHAVAVQVLATCRQILFSGLRCEVSIHLDMKVLLSYIKKYVVITRYQHLSVIHLMSTPQGPPAYVFMVK